MTKDSPPQSTDEIAPAASACCDAARLQTCCEPEANRPVARRLPLPRASAAAPHSPRRRRRLESGIREPRTLNLEP